ARDGEVHDHHAVLLDDAPEQGQADERGGGGLFDGGAEREQAADHRGGERGQDGDGVAARFGADREDHVHDEDGEDDQRDEAAHGVRDDRGLAVEGGAGGRGEGVAGGAGAERDRLADGNAGNKIEVDGDGGELVEVVDRLRAGGF